MSDLEQLRMVWESDEMWSMRRAFLRRNWDDESMTKNRLLALSHMYINMEFLGCSYDDSLMIKVREMSIGLSQDRHERRKEVADALFEKEKPKPGNLKNDKPFLNKHRRFSSEVDEASPKKKIKADEVTVVNVTTEAVCAPKLKFMQTLKAELVIMRQQNWQNDPLATLNLLCNRTKCRWRLDFDSENNVCSIKIDDILVVVQAYWGCQSKSRFDSCARTVEILQRPFFDVRISSESASSSRMSNMDFELYTRREARSDWDGPSTDKFESLENALSKLRKRLAGISEAKRAETAEKVLREAAVAEELSVDIKRQHLGGWREEIIVIVGAVELVRQQGRIPAKGKEAESLNEPCSKAIEFLMKSAVEDRIHLAEECEKMVIVTKGFSSASKIKNTKPPSPAGVEQQDDQISKKELSLKSVRQHLDAISDQINAVSRLDQACAKAQISYTVRQSGDGPFQAHIVVDNVAAASAWDSTRKGAKLKACYNTIELLLRPQIRVTRIEGGENGVEFQLISNTSDSSSS